MPTGLTRFHVALLALWDDAKQERRRAGLPFSLREIAKTLRNNPPHQCPSAQRISAWTSTTTQRGEPRTPVLPSPGRIEEVIALVELLSEWAGHTSFNGQKWRTLHEQSLPGRVAATPAPGPAVDSDVDRRVVFAGARRVPVASELFVGRSEELERLESQVAGSGRVVVVHGLGGVGKSTLVARFGELHGDEYELVWWVTADSLTAIDLGLADLAVAVGPETLGDSVEQRVDAGLRWLSTHHDWLLVLDNLTAPGDADALLSRVRTGTVVITSRRSIGWRGMPTVPVDVLSASEAKDLLVRTMHFDWPEADFDGAERLCAELGWLPLAVHQVGAYIAQTRITPAAYLKLLDRYPARMFTETAEDGDSQRTMARVWHVTLDRLSDTPAAGSMLQQLAWYAPDDIPRALVIEHPRTQTYSERWAG